MNEVHCAVMVQPETKVRRSVMERDWMDVLRQRTRYYFTVVTSVTLPRSGSLVHLFYDDSLGKIFIDSLLSLETVWGIHLPLLMTLHFCNGIGNKCT